MKIKLEKFVMVLTLIFAVCLGSIFSADAASKIKSKSVSLNASKVTVGIGDIVTLDAIMKPTNSTDTITWSSSKKRVATVNKYGVVTAVSEGTATITAKTSSKKTARCSITVKTSLSEKEVSDLIAKNCLSEETVKKMIADNVITESQVITLIKQNSLTEADVRKIVAETSGGSASSSVWQDGEQLSIHNQSLPLTLTAFQRPNTTYEGTITKCIIRKYHFNNERSDIPQKYKYTFEIEGTVPDHSDTSNYNYWSSIYITYINSNGDFEPDYRRYPLLCNEDDDNIGNIISTYSENEDGSFVLKGEQYFIFEDYDEYMINGFDFERESLEDY